MISMYQKPRISFKAFSCNFVYFFSTCNKKPKQTNPPPPNKKPKQTNNKKINPNHPTLLKPEHRQDCEVSFFLENCRAGKGRKRSFRYKEVVMGNQIQIHLQINILCPSRIAGWDQASTREPCAVRGCHLLERAALTPEHPPEIVLDSIF